MSDGIYQIKDCLLNVENLTMTFGGLTAVNEVSFSVGRGEITALIGPNGAGKTTVFNCLTGFYRPSAGKLTLTHHTGQRFQLEKMADFQITAQAKVARTFQNIRLFSHLSVLENLTVAQHNDLMRASGYTFSAMFGLGDYAKAEKKAIELASYWLDKIGLYHRADDAAADLAYGDQRRLEIARALCTNPALLCLDEPAAGLNPKETAALNQLLQYIRAHHPLSILLIEHDMSVVMGISDHVIVLDYGRKISDGSPAYVRQDPAVIAAYLGVEDPQSILDISSHGEIHA